MSSLALIVALTLAGHPPSAIPKPKPIDLTGKVKEIGGGPGGEAQAILVLDDASEWTLYAETPEERSELRRLSGVRAKIYGLVNDPRLPTGNSLMSTRYEILDVGKGVVPRIGTIAALKEGGKVRLLFVDNEGTADLLPDGWLEKMQKHVGSKVWIIGSYKAERFNPQRFQILRTGPKAAPEEPNRAPEE